MRVGMIVTDALGTIIDLNESACVMLGKSEITLLGSPWAPLLAEIESRDFNLVRHPVTGPGGRIEAWHFELRERGGPLPPPHASPEAPLPTAKLPSESPILSLGELRVVEMLAQNLSNKEIADRLGISGNTVKFHLANVYKKTGAHGRAELIHSIGDAIAGSGPEAIYSRRLR
jgi:DNA-binding CsgD family transcriptional regulator